MHIFTLFTTRLRCEGVLPIHIFTLLTTWLRCEGIVPNHIFTLFTTWLRCGAGISYLFILRSFVHFCCCWLLNSTRGYHCLAYQFCLFRRYYYWTNQASAQVQYIDIHIDTIHIHYIKIKPTCRLLRLCFSPFVFSKVEKTPIAI